MRITSRVPGFVLATLALGACSDPAPVSTSPAEGHASPEVTTTPAPAPPHSPEEAAAVASAEAAATELGRTLRTRLLAAMAEGGPIRAAEVCATEAPALTAQVHDRSGARVGRGSLRMRGASVPPAWVQAWLDAQGERPAAGVTGFARVEDGQARVLRPIAMEPACLTCHGRELAPEIAAILDARYPNDRARGYVEGDLRGALWAEVDVR